MDFDLDKMYCGAIRRGDVVVFEKGKKDRIMVVLQDDVLNASLPTVLGAEIYPFKKGGEVFLNEVFLPGEETGLGKDGVCMLHKVLTVERSNIVLKKGELTQKRLKEIFKALDITFGRFRDRG